MSISVREPLDVLNEDFKDLAQWLKPLCRYYGRIEDFIIIDYKEEKLHLTFFTKEHSYHIRARLPKIVKRNEKDTEKWLDIDAPQECFREIDTGYLGCTGQCRKPRAGEDWTRGSDLPDGSYSKETWDKIISAIVAHELVKVVKLKDEKYYVSKKSLKSE